MKFEKQKALYSLVVLLGVGIPSGWGQTEWRAVQQVPTGNDLKGIAYDAAQGLYLAVGLKGTMVSSAEPGVGWETLETGIAADLNAVAIGAAGVRVAVGRWGTLIRSEDGQRWERVVAPAGEDLYGVVWHRDGFIAVGAGGTVLRSEDAYNWERQAGFGKGLLYAAHSDGDRVVLVGDGGAVWTSTDGRVWQRLQIAGVEAELWDVDTDGTGRWIVVGDAGTVLLGDGLSFARSQFGSGANLYGCHIAAAGYYVMGELGAAYYKAFEWTAWYRLPVTGGLGFLGPMASDGSEVLSVGQGGTVARFFAEVGGYAGLYSSGQGLNFNGIIAPQGRTQFIGFGAGHDARGEPAAIYESENGRDWRVVEGLGIGGEAIVRVTDDEGHTRIYWENGDASWLRPESEWDEWQRGPTGLSGVYGATAGYGTAIVAGPEGTRIAVQGDHGDNYNPIASPDWLGYNWDPEFASVFSELSDGNYFDSFVYGYSKALGALYYAGFADTLTDYESWQEVAFAGEAAVLTRTAGWSSGFGQGMPYFEAAITEAGALLLAGQPVEIEGGGRPLDIAVDGADQVVAVFEGGRIYAHDPLTFEFVQVRAATGIDLNAVARIGNRYIAVGDAAVVLSSEDGIVWEQIGIAGLEGTELLDVGVSSSAQRGPALIVVGTQGTIAVAPLENLNPDAFSIKEALLGGYTVGGWQVLAGGGVVNYLAGAVSEVAGAPIRYHLLGTGGVHMVGSVATAATIAWERRSLPVRTRISSIVSLKAAGESTGSLIIAGEGGALYHSVDGVEWTTVQSGVSADWRALAQAGDWVWVVGEDGFAGRIDLRQQPLQLEALELGVGAVALRSVLGLAAEGGGHFYVGTADGWVRHYAATGSLIAEFGGFQDRMGEAVAINALAADSQRRVWAAGAGGQVYDVHGRRAVPTPATADLKTLVHAHGMYLAAGEDGTVLQSGVWPEQLTATKGILEARVLLTWQPVEAATGYRVERRRPDLLTGEWDEVDYVAGALVYEDTTAELGQAYEYRVIAQRSARVSPFAPYESGYSRVASGYRQGTSKGVLAWGGNQFGQSAVPEAAAGALVVKGGYLNSLAITGTRELVLWGRALSTDVPRPAQLPMVEDAVLGYGHCVVLGLDGSVHAWGANGHGQCEVPEDLGPVVAIAAGFDFTMALQADGIIRAWGGNAYGQLGLDGASGYRLIAAGGHTAYGVTGAAMDSVTVVGNTAYGQASVPVDLAQLAGAQVEDIQAGIFHAVVLDRAGAVYAWGRETEGQLEIAVPPQAEAAWQGWALRATVPGGVQSISAAFFATALLMLEGAVASTAEPSSEGLAIAEVERVQGFALGFAHSLSTIGNREDWYYDRRWGWRYGYGTGWDSSDWLGFVYTATEPWILHPEFGWIAYISGGFADGFVWLWSPLPQLSWIAVAPDNGGWFQASGQGWAWRSFRDSRLQSLETN